jgi:hypothetical protein
MAILSARLHKNRARFLKESGYHTNSQEADHSTFAISMIT